jgi:lipopolysaccharide export LptBFGC system permease protein LptF
MTLRELRAQAELFRNALPPRVAVEYHRKFAIPAASLIFALIAAPLSLQAARGGRFVGMGFAVVLLFVYYVAMSVARALGTTGLVTPFLSAWAPNLLFLAGGCLLVAREEGWLRMPVPAAPAVMAPGNRP